MEKVVLNQLRQQRLTLAVAEGLTGGVLSARLSEIDHGMVTFRGGAVIGELKDSARSGAEIAAETAAQVRREFAADIGLAVTAAQNSDEQPGGTVFLDLAMSDAHCAATTSLPGDRARFRNYAVINVLNFLRKTLNELHP